MTLAEDFSRERSQRDAENADRVQFQLQSIEAYRDRRIATERQRIANLGTSPRSRGLVLAAERTVERLLERFQVQMAKIEYTKSIRATRETVGRGLIQIAGVGKE
jgi:hypothetical protein